MKLEELMAVLASDPKLAFEIARALSAHPRPPEVRVLSAWQGRVGNWTIYFREDPYGRHLGFVERIKGQSRFRCVVNGKTIQYVDTLEDARACVDQELIKDQYRLLETIP